MALIQQIETWTEAHQSKLLSVLRISLGLVIAGKGAALMQNNEALLAMVENSQLSYLTFIIIHYINMVHIPAGLLIAAGLITRVAILFQLPILIGAVFFINLPSVLEGPTEFILSLLVLVLALFFFFYGAGPWSVDQMLKKQNQ